MRDLLGHTIEGKYELIRVIGEGGIGAVFEARHRLIGRRLAIKVLLPEMSRNAEVVRRFHTDARVAAALGHEHIIDVVDMGVLADGAPFLVMGYHEGETLAQRIARDGPLPVRRAVEVAVQMLDALAVVHEAGVVHRNIKPHNVFLSAQAGAGGRMRITVKLLDFGAPSFRAPGSDSLHMTGSHLVRGAPYYLSPEQAAGDDDPGPQTDVYSTAVVLYEALTGTVPHRGDTYGDLMAAILAAKPKSPREIRAEMPVGLDAAVLKGMARDPRDRYANAVEFLEALKPYASPRVVAGLARSGIGLTMTPAQARALMDAQGQGPSGTTVAAMEAAGVGPSRRRMWIGIFAGGLLAAAGLVLFLLSRGGADDSPAATPPAAERPEPDAGGSLGVPPNEAPEAETGVVATDATAAPPPAPVESTDADAADAVAPLPPPPPPADADAGADAADVEPPPPPPPADAGTDRPPATRRDAGAARPRDAAPPPPAGPGIDTDYPM
jgi:serine/threonine-protein kinase